MIVKELKKSGGAGAPLYYLIIDQAIEQIQASRVAGIAVHKSFRAAAGKCRDHYQREER